MKLLIIKVNQKRIKNGTKCGFCHQKYGLHNSQSIYTTHKQQYKNLYIINKIFFE